MIRATARFAFPVNPGMKKIQLFIYDFDGTLVDTKLDIADSVNRTLRELGLRGLSRETIFGYVGNGVEPLLSRSVEGTGFTDIQKAVEIFKNLYDKHLLDQTCFYPHCRETIDFFSQKSHAIFSNKPVYFIKRILAELDFIQPFVAILGGDSIERKKPDPQGLLHIMETLHVPPHKVLMVGDSAIDIETGKRANVSTCAVTYGLGSHKALEEARPDWIIQDFAELENMFC